ncbi:hypothetical protein AB835_02440 [Candidatus Endobugula sertula]|uniref:GHMP kinase C-terminal domain-containing protein n=1 Tax=Candidatus Endobugula sertula TaxID=62101 RepID=A0A1D2QSQ9_9GAMM|nr:hypothetical protein AB835_02440 [Candidatus Endobugula sertula]
MLRKKKRSCLIVGGDHLQWNTQLLVRKDFPEDWTIVMWVSSSIVGMSGLEEKAFMKAKTPIPKSEVNEVTYIILMQLLPALIEHDLIKFCHSVDNLQSIGWKKLHWERYKIDELKTVQAIFSSVGIHECNLSSTGPTLFGFLQRPKTDFKMIKKLLQKKLYIESNLKGEIIFTKANNQGLSLIETAHPC